MGASGKNSWTALAQTVALSLAVLGALFAIVYLLWCGARNDVSGEARAGHLLVGILFVWCGVGQLVSTQRCSPILTVVALFYFLLVTMDLLGLSPLSGRLSLLLLAVLIVAAAGMMLLPPLLAAFASGTMRPLRAVLWLLALAFYGAAFATVGWTRYPWAWEILMLSGALVWLAAIVITAVALKDTFFASTRSIGPQQVEPLIRNRTDEGQPHTTIIDRERKP